MKRIFQILCSIFICCVVVFCSSRPTALASDPSYSSDILISEAVDEYAAQLFSEYKENISQYLSEATISAIHKAIDMQLISCEELVAYCIDRIKAQNDTYNCFITLCDDALSIAREKDKLLSEGKADGKLFGIPVVIKDNMDLAGYYTTNGHYFSKSRIANDTADCVQKLIDAGAIIIGKTNMSTDANSARASESLVAGQTKNAYNSLLTSGGSSGGSATAVSWSFGVSGLGTDTNSSLRLPAVLNGCISLRPTLSLVPTNGVTSLNNTRDTVGAITRSVYDQAIMLDVLTDNKYSYTENLNPNALKGLKIGILSELTYPYHKNGLRAERNIDHEVALAFEKAVEELKACGAEVTVVSMPNIFSLSSATFNSDSRIYKNKLYDNFIGLLDSNDLDAVIYPSYLNTPLRSGTDQNGIKYNYLNQTFINNSRVLSPSCSAPAIAIPIGYHSLGAGIGMEIISRKNSEQLLLDIAYSYTLQYDHRLSPDETVNEDTLNLEQVILNYYAAIDRFKIEEQNKIKAEELAIKEREKQTATILYLSIIAGTIFLLAIPIIILTFLLINLKKKSLS